MTSQEAQAKSIALLKAGKKSESQLLRTIIGETAAKVAKSKDGVWTKENFEATVAVFAKNVKKTILIIEGDSSMAEKVEMANQEIAFYKTLLNEESAKRLEEDLAKVRIK